MKAAVACLFVLGLTGCGLLPTPPEPRNQVCLIYEPTLPQPNDDGDVVLKRHHQIELLVYIETLEQCLEQASSEIVKQ